MRMILLHLCSMHLCTVSATQVKTQPTLMIRITRASEWIIYLDLWCYTDVFIMITSVVSRLARSDTPNIVVMPWVQSPMNPHNHHHHVHGMHIYIQCIQQSGRKLKTMNAKNMKKITDSWECGREHKLRFWWRWHQPFRSQFPHTHTASHIVSSIIVRYLLIENYSWWCCHVWVRDIKNIVCHFPHNILIMMI